MIPARRVVGLVVAGAAWGCERPADPAVIAVAFGVDGVDAVRVSQDELTTWPLRIELVFDTVNSGESADVEVERAHRLAATRGLVAVVGHASSRGTLAAAPVYNEAGIPHVVPTATSRLLAAAGPWTFALAPDDSVEGTFIGEFVAGPLGAGSVTIYFLNDEYGEGLRDGVRARLRELDVDVLDEVSVDPRSDFPTLVEASMRRGVPDAVVVAARWIEAGAVARLVRARAPSVPVVAGDGALQLPALAREVGEASSGLYVVSFWMPDPSDSLHRAFVDRFRRVAARDPLGTHAMTHDAIMLLATAVREVGRDPERIRDFLLSRGAGRAPYRGVTGPLAFGAARRANFAMARLEGDRVVRVPPP